MTLLGKGVMVIGIGVVKQPGTSDHEKPFPLLDLKRQETGLCH